MRKISVYRCPECRKPFRTLGSWANHMNNAHPEVRPKGYTDQRFFYYILTGKTHGNCIVCKKETEWNEETGKYNRFCSNPKCKEDYRNVFKKRMISKYGKITMMDDPEFARKALANRKISGSYKFSDGGELSYVGSYEKDFLMMMDKLLNFKSTDIMAPSPHTYYYEYEGEKHYYIPDFFIPNYNLEIEIKQNESTHPKILAVDKVKEQKKDEVMFANKAIIYIKLMDKKYEPFIEFLLKLKDQIPENELNKSEAEKQKMTQEAVYGDADSKYKKYSSVFESIIEEEFQRDCTEIAQEGYVFDSKNVEYRVDEFKNGKENILFIVGRSGSGKTTLSNKISKEYDTEVVHLDDMMTPGKYSDDQLKKSSDCLYSYFASVGAKYRNVKKWTSDVYYNLTPDLIKYIDRNAKRRIIIEGFHLLENEIFDSVKGILKRHAVLIMGTSFTKSAFRNSKRDTSDEPNQLKRMSAILKMFANETKYAKYYETRRKELINELSGNSDVFESNMQSSIEKENHEIAQEGYVFDSKNVEYRVDEFKNGKENILFITGLSGSGKTTLSREMGKGKNIEVIALDDMMVPGMFSDENLKEYHPLIYNFFTTTAIGASHRNNKNYNEDMMLNVLPDFIHFISDNSSSQKFIIEGFYFVNEKFFSKVKNIVKRHSIMIIGTSMIKSFYRRMKRNEKYPERSKHKRSELIINAFQNDAHWQNGLNKLIKEVKEWDSSIAQEAVAGSFIDTRPYDNPIPTPSPDPEYVPQNVIPSKYEVGPGALLKSDNVVKAMLPCVMDEISGEPSDGTKPILLPVKKLNKEQNADPNEDYQITDREKAVDRTNAILNRFDQYSILSRKKYLTELKSLILKWNIDIDLSKYPKVKRLLFEINSPTTEVYNSGYIFDYYGIAFPGNQSYAMEGRIENPDDLHPVYILLTHSSTLLANIIKKFTGDKYSHAAICFDPSFKEFYTFGRKKSGGGFAIESPYIDFYKERPEVPYGIYCVFVTSAQLKEMKKKLQVFIDNEDKYKYHFAGLIKIAFGKESENDTHYFCSGFVVDILQAGGLSKARSYTLYKPQDLTHLYSSYKIDFGNGLQNIKEELIRKNTKIAKEKYIKRFYK